MKNLNIRLEKIEKNLKQPNKNIEYMQFLAIECWRYEMITNTNDVGQIIYLQSWKKYCDRQLELAKQNNNYEEEEKELKDLEEKIDKGDGFNKITFVKGDEVTGEMRL